MATDDERSKFDASVIPIEVDWQRPPSPPVEGMVPPTRVRLARWSQAIGAQPLVMQTDHVDDSHFITYSLVSTQVDFRIGNGRITNGLVPRRRVLLQGPTWQWRSSTYRQGFDFMRIYFPQALLASAFEYLYGRSPNSEIVLFDTHFASDLRLSQLTDRLLPGLDEGGVLGPAFVEELGLALATRLVQLYGAQRAGGQPRWRSGPLAKWRLHRVLDYIESHLGEPISLASLSQVAGIEQAPMVTQFRKAMGCPPYAYILRRRISRAQQLLRADRQLSLAELALMLGFSSQAHFTDAFSRMVGVSPARWRAGAA